MISLTIAGLSLLIYAPVRNGMRKFYIIVLMSSCTNAESGFPAELKPFALLAIVKFINN